MLVTRELPPKKFPARRSADEYFCLAVQYLMLGKIRYGIKAIAKAMAGHSHLGREFVIAWMNRSGHGIKLVSLNHGQYLFVTIALFTVDALASTLVPTVKFLWNTATRVSDVWQALLKKTKGKSHQDDSVALAAESLTAVISRVTIPKGLTPEAYFDLGKRYKQNGWINQSQEALKLAENLAPVDSPVAVASHKYLKAKVPRAQVPLEVEVENIQGYHALSRGDLKECQKIFGRLMEQHPNFEWPYLNLASAYIKEMQMTEAKFLLRKLLSINPDHVEAWTSLARIHLASFEIEAAQQALAEARALYVDDSDASIESMVDCLAMLEEPTSSDSKKRNAA
ncbi:MAG TPA: tetratricopeptide repeat protein [Drouetiella sp.]